MDKESRILLQNIDCNCNDCIFMTRDLEKFKSYDHLHIRTDGRIERGAGRVNYGECCRFKKPVSFIPNTIQMDTQDCFVHRRSIQKA